MHLNFMQLLTNHNFQNFPVGFPHTDSCHAAHIFNGVIYALGDNTITGVELITVLEQTIAQNACIYSSSDLGSTGGLGAITGNAGNNCQSIDNRMSDLTVSAAL